MTIKEFNRFFEPVKKQKLLTFIYVLFSAFSSFFWIYSVEIIKKITQEIEKGNLNNVYFLTYLFIVFILFFQIIRWYGKDINPVFLKNSKIFIQEKYIKKFILFENNSYEKIGTGKLIALIDKGIDVWSRLINDFLYFGLQYIFSFIFAIFYIYKIIGIYIIIILFIIIILLFITKFVNSKSIESRIKMVDYSNLYTKDLVKIIMSKFEILQNDKVNVEIDRLNFLSEKETFYYRKRILWLEINFGLNRFFINMLKILSIFIVGVGVIKGIYGFSDFLAIIAILTILDANIGNSVNFYKDFTKEYVKIDKFYDLFDQIPKIENYGKGKKFNYINGNFEIKDLSFYYDEKLIFNKFNLNIKGGKKTAIIGKSGSGKTTLIKLITGFLKADSGEIIIDNQNLSQISLKTYYKHIGYLTQEPSIFDGTIIDNLTYGTSNNIKKSDIKNALNKAEANFVYDFVDGLNTEIGERGIRLSGGQRQRLAIAKIFIKNPEIIVLDEPTSALDSFSEESVSHAINNLFNGRTVIIIAHRLQTVKQADEIIILDDFKVKERGTHIELFKSGKYYKKMVDLQSGTILE